MERAANARRAFFEALWELAHRAYIAKRDAGLAAAAEYAGLNEDGKRDAILNARRLAVAAQLLTPAPSQAALNWKMAVMASRRLYYVPVEAGALACALADDKAWLAAHKPGRKKPAQC